MTGSKPRELSLPGLPKAVVGIRIDAEAQDGARAQSTTLLPEKEVRVLAPPTPEMERWARRLRPLLHPTGAWTMAANVLSAAMTTPLAHVSTFSLEFQTYLFSIFHRTTVARVAHLLFMPSIVVATLGGIAQLSPWLAGGASFLLASYYWTLGRRHDMTLLGAITAVFALACGGSGIAWAQSELGSGRTAPILWALALSTVQAMSHIFEDVPPRVNGTHDWMTVRSFLWGPSGSRHPLSRLAKRAAAASAMVFAGGANELWGSWRLLPIVVLHGLWALGYQPAARERHRARLRAATRGSNPAIDFIGTGGTRGGLPPQSRLG